MNKQTNSITSRRYLHKTCCSFQNLLAIILPMLLVVLVFVPPTSGVIAQQRPTPGTIKYLNSPSPRPNQSDANALLSGDGVLQHFQTFDVQGGYDAAGVAMRNRGYGTIELTGIPAEGHPIAAFLYWDILSSTRSDSYARGKINGNAITGKLIGTHGDPCWGNLYNYAYRANVSNFVKGNGTYELTNFASGYTDGRDPWVSGSLAPMTEGASLVVIYEVPNAPVTKVIIYDGSILSSGNQIAFNMDGFTIPNPLAQAKTTFIGADGQNAYKAASTFNDTTLPTVQWNGQDPQNGPNFSKGNLWDTMTVDVSDLMPPDSTSARATVGGGEDCLVWVSQVLSITAKDQQVDCTDADFSRQPLMLIHGWGGPETLEEDKSGFAQLKSHLMDDLGYVDNCNLFYARGVNAANSPQFNRASISANLRLAYKRLTEVNPAWRGHFDIIGHSYGGINARFYLESSLYKQDQTYGIYGIKVDNLFTLGSPHGGVNLSEELYPGAAFIGISHLNDREWLSAVQLLSYQMDSYNINHKQPENTCYRLIGGDFIHQPGIMLKTPEMWLLYSLFYKDPNDIGVSVRSSLQLYLNQALQEHYKNVVANLTVDMHGYEESHSLSDVWSYVRPNRTFDNLILPYLGAGLDKCKQEQQTQQTSIENHLNLESKPSTMLIASGSLLPDQTIIGNVPIDWTSESAFFASSLDGKVDLTLLNPLGTVITPASPATDPNIAYTTLSHDTSNVAIYVIKETIPGQWQYMITNPTSQSALYDLYMVTNTPLSLQVEVTQWHSLNSPVLIKASMERAGEPETGASVIARLSTPDGSRDQIELRDDGVLPDSKASDGVYAGTYEGTDVGGIYHVLVEASGVQNQVSFFRSAQAAFETSSSSALLLSAFSEEAVDSDSNGIYDLLNVRVDMDVKEPTTLSISGVLQGGDGKQVAVDSTTIEAVAGPQTITLSFPGTAIMSSEVDGPYTLTEFIILDDNTMQKQQEIMNAITTRPYSYWQFGMVRFFIPIITR